MEIFAALQIFAGMLVLVAASGLFIHALVQVCRHLKIQEFYIVLIVIGFATALPEFFLALNAAVFNFPEIAFGNAIGTSIASMAFIAGIIAIFGRKLETKTFFKTHDMVTLSLGIALLSILGSDGIVSRFDGLLLIVVFFYYLWNILDRKDVLKLKIKPTNMSPLSHLIVMVFAGFGMILSAKYVLTSTVDLQLSSGLPGFMLAVVLIAPLGAIPELIIELELIRSKLNNLSFGDLFMSVVVNSTFIIGLLALVRPFTITAGPVFTFSGLFLIIIILIFNFFVRTRDQLDWKEGLLLLIGYFFFIICNFLVYNAAL